ncbi:MAG: O-antigen ligase family protein [Trueperaceae bacterium]|nr:O-antigen ligase family protein [Trueperaceae bacterium]
MTLVVLPAYLPVALIPFIRIKSFIPTWADGIFLFVCLLYIWPALFFPASFDFSLGLELLIAWLSYKGLKAIFPKMKSLLPYWRAGISFALLVLTLFNTYAVFTRQVPRAVGLAADPNLLSHSLVVLAAILLIFFKSHGLYLQLLLIFLNILLAGSRAAILGFFCLLALYFLSKLGLNRRTLIWLLTALVVVLGLSLSPGRLGWLRFVISHDSANLLKATEYPENRLWQQTGISVLEQRQDPNLPYKLYTLGKQSPESYMRLQQAVLLEPLQTYTLSAWIRPINSSKPGLLGWGEVEGETFQVMAKLESGELQADVQGPGELLSMGQVSKGSGYEVWISFRYEGRRALIWNLGAAPDLQAGQTEIAEFGALQLVKGDQALPYQAGGLDAGFGTLAARTQYWRAAWQGFLAKPWVGWGQNFSHYYEQYSLNHSLYNDKPSHSHNLYLQVLFERGMPGLISILLLAFIAFRYEQPLWPLWFSLLLMNGFDYTLFYTGTMYSLAVLLAFKHARVQLDLGTS